MQCSEFEGILSEALGRKAKPADYGRFSGPRRQVSGVRSAVGRGRCRPALAQVSRRGRASSASGRKHSGGHDRCRHLSPGNDPKWRHSNLVVGTLSRLGRNRDRACICGRAAASIRHVVRHGFFLAFNFAQTLPGVNESDVRHVDLRPTAIKRNYFETSGRVVKYYENIRFVYEIESRVRDFKRATVPEEPAPEEKSKSRKDNTSEQPEKRQDRNYSQGENQPVLASAPADSPVVTGTTDRRLS